METPDTPAGTLDDLMLDLNAAFDTKAIDIEGIKIIALETEVLCMNRENFDRNALYQELHYTGNDPMKKPGLFPILPGITGNLEKCACRFPVAYK